MGEVIDWTALPVLAEIHGVRDVEALVRALVVIRDHKRGRGGG